MCRIMQNGRDSSVSKERLPALLYNYDNNQLEFHISVEDKTTNKEDVLILQSFSKLIRSKWYTITATYSPDSSLLLLYVNGIMDSAVNISSYKTVSN